MVRLPDGTFFAVAAVIAWFTILLTARANSPGGTLSAVYGVLAFAPDALAVIAVVRFIRWLRRNRHAPPH